MSSFFFWTALKRLRRLDSCTFSYRGKYLILVFLIWHGWHTTGRNGWTIMLWRWHLNVFIFLLFITKRQPVNIFHWTWIQHFLIYPMLQYFCITFVQRFHYRCSRLSILPDIVLSLWLANAIPLQFNSTKKMKRYVYSGVVSCSPSHVIAITSHF